jgi:hypothetical protein
MNGATFLRQFLDKVVVILVIRNLTRTAMKLRRHVALILTSLAIMCAVYTLAFRVTVQRGSVIFGVHENGADAGDSGLSFGFPKPKYITKLATSHFGQSCGSVTDVGTIQVSKVTQI